MENTITNHNNTYNVCLRNDSLRDKAYKLAEALGVNISDSQEEIKKDSITVLFDEKGVSLRGYGLSYQGDFSSMSRRISDGRIHHEMLIKAAKTKSPNPKAIDFTAGMGEDAFLLAASGYEVTLFEQNPIVAALLEDALLRASYDENIIEIVSRMHLIKGNSINLIPTIDAGTNWDLVYLDPMFPKRQKSGLIGKKLQLIQKIEPPSDMELALFEAALSVHPSKIIVKRPLKSKYFIDKKPNHSISGKSIRYDCYLP